VISSRLYRATLLLLPASLRRKHGAAMEELFRERVRDARRRGRVAGLIAALSGLWDVVCRGLYERFRSPTHPSRESPMRSLLYDLRHALRGLLRSPRFAALAVLTLALGIGANSALFSVVHGVVLRPLPFPDADRVTHLAWARGDRKVSSVPAYKVAFWSERARSFEAMTTWWERGMQLGGADASEPVDGLLVPHTFLEVVGHGPAIGRDFTADDDVPGAPPVAILGHELWRTRFGADPDIVDTTILLDGEPHSVIGVLPADYAFPQATVYDDVLVPMQLDPEPTDESENYPILARLAPGMTLPSAQADLDRVYRDFQGEHPELMNGTDRGMTLASYQELYVGDVGTTLWILMGATALVLLIACANVAALLLARGQARRSELAVRTALGAGRGRLVRQILTESLVLAGLASVVGLGLALVSVDVLVGLYPGRLPRTEWIGVNGTVLAYTALAALATGAVFGLIAALPVLRGRVAGALREAGTRSSRRGGVRRVLLAAESAVSLVLLVAAGLLITTLDEIRKVDPGFTPDDLVTASLPEPTDGWGAPGETRAHARRVLESVRALSEVRSATVASTYPLARGLNIPVGIRGRPEAYEGAVEWRAATPGYLETLEIALLEGRALRETDGPGSPPVALVNRAFAERWFPDGSAVGRYIEIGRYRDRYIVPALDVGGVRIVGIVDDVREISLKSEARRTVFVPAAQVPAPLASPPVLVARLRPGASTAGLRQTLVTAGGGTPPSVESMEAVISASLAGERFNALLMTVFASVALLLTAFGIYGVVSYGARQRTREIGIRMALGARRSEIARLVVGQGMAPVVVGLVIGAAASVWLSGLIESLLWGVSPGDPRTVVTVACVLALVALVASYVPVRQVTAVDPKRSLRPE